MIVAFVLLFILYLLASRRSAIHIVPRADSRARALDLDLPVEKHSEVLRAKLDASEDAYQRMLVQRQHTIKQYGPIPERIMLYVF